MKKSAFTMLLLLFCTTAYCTTPEPCENILRTAIPLKGLNLSLNDDLKITWLTLTQTLFESGADHIGDPNLRSLVQKIVQDPSLLENEVVQYNPGIIDIIRQSDMGSRLRNEVEFAKIQYDPTYLNIASKPLSKWQKLKLAFLRWYRGTPKHKYNIAENFLNEISRYELDYRQKVILSSIDQIGFITYAELFSILRLVREDLQLEVYQALAPRVFTPLKFYSFLEVGDLTQGISREIISSVIKKENFTISKKEFWSTFENPELFKKLQKLLAEGGQELLAADLFDEIKSALLVAKRIRSQEKMELILSFFDTKFQKINFLKAMAPAADANLIALIMKNVAEQERKPEQSAKAIIRVALADPSLRDGILRKYVEKHHQVLSSDEILELAKATPDQALREWMIKTFTHASGTLIDVKDILRLVTDAPNLDTKTGIITKYGIIAYYVELHRSRLTSSDYDRLVEACPDSQTKTWIRKIQSKL